MNLMILAGMWTASISMPLQAQVRQQLHVTVTDPLNRFVSGLEPEHFEVAQKGVQRTFSISFSPDSPVTLALVIETPQQAVVGLAGPKDLLIQTRSLADALAQLSVSTNSRKCLIVSAPLASDVAIPVGVEVHTVEPTNLRRWVVELRNQYVLQIDGSGSDSEYQILLKQPRGLPTLKANWKQAAAN